MNTKQDTPGKNRFIKVPPDDENFADWNYLVEELQKTKTQLRKERLLFVVAALVFANVYFFIKYSSGFFPIVAVLISELFLIALAGRVYDIKEIELVTDKFLSLFPGKKREKDK